MAPSPNSNNKRYRSIHRSNEKRQSTFNTRHRKLTSNKKIVINEKTESPDMQRTLALSPDNASESKDLYAKAIVKKESFGLTPTGSSKGSRHTRQKTHGVTLNKTPQIGSPKVGTGLAEKNKSGGKGTPPVKKLSMLSYQEETTIAPSVALGASGVKSAIRQHFTDSPIFGSGKKVDLKLSKQQDFNKTMVDTFTPCSWKTGQSSLEARAKNQPTHIERQSANLADFELTQEQPRKILKAKRTTTGSNEEVHKLSHCKDPSTKASTDKQS